MFNNGVGVDEGVIRWKVLSDVRGSNLWMVVVIVVVIVGFILFFGIFYYYVVRFNYYNDVLFFFEYGGYVYGVFFVL